ncbi:MAG: hypothetical protein QXQ61_04700 [Candidatus Bathyarchaeia archaeon]
MKIKEKANEERGLIDDAWRLWKEFVSRFPFREKPQLIDNLTPTDVYNPGVSGYFFDYIEHKLKPLGHIYVPSDKPWRSARDNLDDFKVLLKEVVNDSISLADKVDAEWDRLSGWGGDRHYAKKLIFCYYPDEVIPIFKTEHLEHFINVLELTEDTSQKAMNKFRKSYNDLTVGQKFELLNNALLDFKKSEHEIKEWDNALYMRSLYAAFPPFEVISPEKVIEPMSATRMLFSPVNELGVVTLFAMYHRELGFPYILKIKSDYPDAIVIDELGDVKLVEFELFASNFIAHGHDPDKCDYVVCWENDLPENVEDKKIKMLNKKIVALKERLGKLEE